METHSLNSLAMMLEVDRATLQRALRNTPPDLVTGKRQSFKVSTAVSRLKSTARLSAAARPAAAASSSGWP